MSPRRLGQHFLADASWRARILGLLGARPEDVWLEIGAGHGEMTRELARAAARVVAIELDPPLVEMLRRLARELPNVEVVPGDILALDLTRILPAGARVYGNLPYYITSPILARLFQHAGCIASIHVVIQLEVAERIAAQPGRRAYGYLSVLAQFYSRPKILLRLPPGAFRPRPKVASALVALKMPGARASLGITDEPPFLKFVQTCFAHKRKTLANNLRAHFPPEIVDAMLMKVGVPARARAEELSVAEFAALFQDSCSGRL
jgi:16S rRNA (adenine1518-N6/adenine1519-N6)-dimethyltransferase